MKRFLLLFMFLFHILPVFSLAEPTITVSKAAVEPPAEILQQIAMDYPNANAITIITWMDADLSATLSKQIAADYPANVSVAATGWQTPFTVRSAYQTIYYQDVARETTQFFTVLEDILLTTRAMGSQGPLDEDFDHTVISSLTQRFEGEPPLSFAELNMTEFLRALISADEVFTGPAENSGFTSREYRIRWIGNSGTWSAIHIPEPGDFTPVSGEWTEVTGYIVYAIDRFIIP